MKANGFNNVELKPNVSELKQSCPIPFEQRKKILIMAGNISRERGVMQFLLHFKEVIYYSPDLELHIYSDFKDKKLQKADA